MDNFAVLATAVVVGLFSSARLTRLVVEDTFPPMVWLRVKWDTITNDGPWSLLAHCHWCLSLWMVIPIGLWGWLTELQTAWWVFNVWLAAGYVAGMIVERDEKE